MDTIIAKDHIFAHLPQAHDHLTMRAVQVARFGGPEVLQLVDVERPAPISTEVLVRVIAAGVNPVDCKSRRGEGVARWLGQPPFIVGWDVCGTVEAMGYGVTRFQVGDLVYGMPRFPRSAGGYAEYIAAPSRQLARAPKGISTAEAAALPLAVLTAWQCLVDSAQLKGGQTVLVHGASGGVGHLAAQIAEARGGRVVASKHRGDREALSARDVDVAMDLVGGADTETLLATVREGGVLLAVADGADDKVKSEAMRRGVRVMEPLVEPDGHGLEEIAKLVESGGLKVNVEEAFPLEQAVRAHEAIERGGRKGKLVLVI